MKRCTSPSVASWRLAGDTSPYDATADSDCQKNFIVYLTDGLPQSDSNSDATIEALPNFQSINGYARCTGGRVLASDGDGTGQCLDELARWLHESDMRPDRPGVQNVTSYWIGLGSGVAAGTDTLQHVAQRGGGQYFAAGDTAELEEAFTQIVSRILAQTTTFTAPTVAVNAFNRTQNLNFLYMSVFKPSASYRWTGNIKKYRITPEGVIRDAQGNAAVDPANGFFRDNSQSYWSSGIDGANAALGGAEKSPGTKVFCVSGHVMRPGNYEVVLHETTLRELIYDMAGGFRPGHEFKACWVGGSSVPVLGADALDTPLDYESLNGVGTFLGSAGCIVMDDSGCIVRACLRLAHFYRHESCGKCSPCREGTGWLENILQRMVDGNGRMEDLELLERIFGRMFGRTLCALADGAVMPLRSARALSRDEFVRVVEPGSPRPQPMREATAGA